MPAASTDRRKWIARLPLFLAFFLTPLLTAAQDSNRRRGSAGEPGWGEPPDHGGAARQTRQSREKALKQFEDICETLVLDAGQRKKAHALFESSQQEIEQAYEKFSRDKIGAEELNEATRRINDKLLDDFGKVLNEEQVERFELIRKEMLENRSHGR